ncbi:MAG: MFS transporter permease, partial [Acidimicrobiia bacterium]
MSYGKVDHDRFAYLVALAALPTAGAARWGDATRSERAGWALRVTQVAVIATYFLAALAKLRFGGLAWLNSATLTWAVMRRGTVFGDWLMDVPGAMVAMQWFILAFELGSPLVLVASERARWRIVGCLYGFHAGVYATVTIAFWPHLVALAAFLPLERVRPVEAVRAARARLVGTTAGG